MSYANSFIAELSHFHVQSAWEIYEERVRDAGLGVYCNYLQKKKKKTLSSCSSFKI